MTSDDNDSSQSELEVNLEVQQLKIFFIMQLLSRFMVCVCVRACV